MLKVKKSNTPSYTTGVFFGQRIIEWKFSPGFSTGVSFRTSLEPLENLAFYATLEECYAPGRFDLFCNSHQLLVGVLGILQGVYWCPSLMLQQKQCVLSLFSITSSSPQISDERHRRETLKILPFWSFSPYRFRPRLWHCFIYIAIAGYAEATWHLKKNCSSSWNVSLLCGLPLEYRFLSIHHTHPTLPTNPDTYESPKIMKTYIRIHIYV